MVSEYYLRSVRTKSSAIKLQLKVDVGLGICLYHAVRPCFGTLITTCQTAILGYYAVRMRLHLDLTYSNVIL
jgi:hypothetical protein